MKDQYKYWDKSDHLAYFKAQTFGLWHIDAIIIFWYGTRRVIFTAIEELTKIAYARVYSTNSSKNAADVLWFIHFLSRLNYLVKGEINR